MTPEDITRALIDAELNFSAAQHLVIEADQHHEMPDICSALYAGSCAHSLLAIAGQLRIGLEPEA